MWILTLNIKQNFWEETFRTRGLLPSPDMIHKSKKRSDCIQTKMWDWKMRRWEKLVDREPDCRPRILTITRSRWS